MSGLEDYPKPQENDAKGEEKMAVIINPFRRDDLKAVISQLTTERGEGTFSDADIIERATIVKMDRKINPLGPNLKHEVVRAEYRETLSQLREHPEEWKHVVLTFEQQKQMELKRTGKKLKEPSDWRTRWEEEHR